MKSIKLAIAFLLVFLAGIGNVMADGGHFHHHRTHIGVVIGPYWGPYWDPWYYPLYGPPIVIEQAPPVYIEQQPAAPASTQTNYWYYCNAARAYFPYVKECPSGWQKVLPRPPG